MPENEKRCVGMHSQRGIIDFLKKSPEYFGVGHMHIFVPLFLVLTIVVCYLAKIEFEVADWKNLIQLFVTVSGVIFAFIFHGNLRLGLEFNRLLEYEKSEPLRNYWRNMKRDLRSMFLSFGLLLILLIGIMLFEKRVLIPSDDFLFLLSLFDFAWFMYGFAGSLVRQYLFFEWLSAIFSPEEEK